MEIHQSARRHHVADLDMVHAINNSIAIDDLGEGPDRWLVIGPNRAGHLLEIVLLVTHEGTQMIIHAMPLRPVYRKLLER